MKIITMISFSDFIANAAALNGVPSDRDWCVLQAIAAQFFFPASWIWTTILTYLLYSLVAHGKILMPEWQMHVITWGLCTLITVLPLTTSTYGVQANDDDWCYIHRSSRPHTGGDLSVMIWEYITFDCVIFASLSLMIMWACLMWWKLPREPLIDMRNSSSSLQFKEQSIKTKRIRGIVGTLFRYPLILLITWLPVVVFLFSGIQADQKSTITVTVCCIYTWQGGLTAIAFFLNSRESRQCWYQLFMRCCSCFTTDTDEVRQRQDTWSADTNATIQLLAEDFESDDVYYGRTNHREVGEEIISNESLPSPSMSDQHISMITTLNPLPLQNAQQNNA
jgi:hypothetical protein